MKKFNLPKSAWAAVGAVLFFVIVIPFAASSGPGPVKRARIDAAVWSSHVSIVDFPVAIPIELHIDDFNDGTFHVDQIANTDSAGFADFNLGSVIVKPGDRIVVVGPGLIHELVVASVNVNAVDGATQVVSGVSPPHSHVDVMLQSTRTTMVRVATRANSRGEWSVRMSRLQHMDGTYRIRAVVYDADGDATHSSREIRVA